MRYVIALGLVATLAACSGDHNQASKRDLTRAINDYHNNHPLCVPVANTLAKQAGNTAHLIQGRLGDEWVHITAESLDGNDINQAATEQMKVLTRAGLYEKAGSKEQKAVLGSELTVPVNSYHITKEGKEQFRVAPQGNLMCVGKIKVDEITWFTEPTPANGLTVTQVRFKPEYELESFAKKLLKQDLPEFKQQFEQQDVSTTLVKTNDGWRDIRELTEARRR